MELHQWFYFVHRQKWLYNIILASLSMAPKMASFDCRVSAEIEATHVVLYYKYKIQNLTKPPSTFSPEMHDFIIIYRMLDYILHGIRTGLDDLTYISRANITSRPVEGVCCRRLVDCFWEIVYYANSHTHTRDVYIKRLICKAQRRFLANSFQKVFVTSG